jgi:hypothetical protein
LAYFTIQDIIASNPPEAKVITLRTHLIKAIEYQTISQIGSIPGGKGAPPKVYSMTPVTKLTLEKAQAANINLVDNVDKLVNVISVSTPKQSTPAPSVSAEKSVETVVH